MFIFSFKSLKSKLILLIAAVAAAVICFVCLSQNNSRPDGEPTSCAEEARDVFLDYSAADGEQRLKFINSLGYTVNADPVSVSEVALPEEFDSVYTQYNELQKEQNLNLEKYKGKQVKKYTYTVTNYPGYENRDCIQITLLIYKGKVIGGDVCSVELDGFMKGFTQ